MQLFKGCIVAAAILGLLSGCGQKSTDISFTTQSPEARGYFMAGLELDDAFQDEEAGRFYEKAIKADPEFAMAYYYWSNLAYTTEEYAHRINKAIELLPKVTEPEKMIIMRAKALFEDEVYLAREYSEKLVKLLPECKRAHYLHGNFYYGRQEWDSAEREYRKTIELDASFTLAYNQLGYVYSNLSNYPEAIKSLQKYSELRPDDPNPHDSMGEIYLWMGDHENSVRSFSQALKLDPNFITARAGLGHNYAFIGEYEKALEEYDKIYEFAESVADTNSAYLWKAICYLHEERFSDAIMTLRDRLKFNQARDDIYAEARTRGHLSAIYIEKSDYKRAMKEIEMKRELAMNTQFQGTLRDQYLRDCAYTEALILCHQKKPELAQVKLTEYEKSARVSNNPNAIKTFHELKGIIDFWKKDYVAAIDELKQADSQSQYAKYYLGLSYSQNDDQATADKIFKEIAGYNRNGLNYAFVRPRVIEGKHLLIAQDTE
ncbi:MAG: tetratricopeptide repeat protein [candidate division Zixibacteria bacterium]|nr:tetratricopeptide repeat protein [candidate division Zixibacteria bacterium]